MASAVPPACPPAQWPAAAFWAGVSEITIPGAEPAGTPGEAAGVVGSVDTAAPARYPPAAAAAHAKLVPPAAVPPRDSPSDTSDGSAADALTYSSNRMVSVPSPRSRTGRAAASRRGGTESAIVSRPVLFRSFSFPARSENAPVAEVADRAAGMAEAPAHADAAAFWAGVSEITTPGAALSGTPGTAAEAASISAAAVSAPASCTLPPGSAHIPPAPPPCAAADRDTREEFDSGTSTYSLNRTVSVPSPRSRTGRAAASRRGAAASAATTSCADALALGLPDGSENAPETRSIRFAPDARAAAFSAGESDRTAAAADAASGSAGGAASTPDMPRAMRHCGSAPASPTRGGRALAISTCSSKRTSSVPAPRSRRGVSSDTDRCGAAASLTTCIRWPMRSPWLRVSPRTCPIELFDRS